MILLVGVPVCASRPCERFQFHRPQCKKRCDRAGGGVRAFTLRFAYDRRLARCTSSSAARLDERKSILVKQGYDPNKTEKQIMEERGIPRIYDCGCLCYKWINNQNNG